jgi:outer membrane lipoprotein LolB
MMRWVPLVGAALIAAACAHREVAVDDGLNNAERQARLAAVADWDMRGRLAIATTERSYQARVAWSQRGSRLELEVRGFLGARSFRIAGDADLLEVEERGESRILTDPEIQLSAEFGWWLPVTSLEYWLLGRPDPDYPRRLDRGSAGTLTSLDQRDWRVAYEEYQLAGGLLVPRRITLRHASLELRLAVTDWSPAGA